MFLSVSFMEQVQLLISDGDSIYHNNCRVPDYRQRCCFLLVLLTSLIIAVVLVASALLETASLAERLGHPPREWKIPGSNPACAGIFLGVESYQ